MHFEISELLFKMAVFLQKLTSHRKYILSETTLKFKKNIPSTLLYQVYIARALSRSLTPETIVKQCFK